MRRALDRSFRRRSGLPLGPVQPRPLERLGALVRERPAFAERPSAVILCGGNLGAELLARTLVAA